MMFPKKEGVKLICQHFYDKTYRVLSEFFYFSLIDLFLHGIFNKTPKMVSFGNPVDAKGVWGIVRFPCKGSIVELRDLSVAIGLESLALLMTDIGHGSVLGVCERLEMVGCHGPDIVSLDVSIGTGLVRPAPRVDNSDALGLGARCKVLES